MVKLRKFVAYRRLERPYTRFSKFKSKSYVRARPVCKVVRFDTGEVAKKFDTVLHIVSKSDLQIRDNAIEAARQTATRALEKALGKTGYYFQVRIYPHHVLRENPLASGAGADRMSTGMARSFGKPIGVAARVKKGSPIFTLKTSKANITLARKVLKKAGSKIPCSCRIIVEQNKMPVEKK